MKKEKTNQDSNKPKIDELQNDLLDLSTVLKIFGISKATLYRIKDFPKPIKIGRQNRWYRPMLRAYIESKANKTTDTDADAQEQGNQQNEPKDDITRSIMSLHPNDRNIVLAFVKKLLENSMPLKSGGDKHA